MNDLNIAHLRLFSPQAELRGYSPDNYSRLSEMKERSESLRSAREEKRRGIAEEKLYEHFRQNCPDMRKVRDESNDIDDDIDGMKYGG